MYNGNYQLFTSITLQFKMFATGLIEKEFRMGAFPLTPDLDKKPRPNPELVCIRKPFWFPVCPLEFDHPMDRLKPRSLHLVH